MWGIARNEHEYAINDPHQHCELRYEPVPQLRALEHFESWFFHGTDDELDRWADGLGRQEFWTIIRDFHPKELKVYREQV